MFGPVFTGTEGLGRKLRPLMPTVQVTVREQGGQELQELFRTPVNSSFAREQLQQLYGPGLLCLESNNTVVAASRVLQPSESYTYELAAGVCGSSLALCHRVSVLQPASMQSICLQHHQLWALCEWLRVPPPTVVLMQTPACMHACCRPSSASSVCCCSFAALVCNPLHAPFNIRADVWLLLLLPAPVLSLRMP